MPPIKRLNPQMVAGDLDLALLEIDENDGKHPVKAFQHAFETVTLVKIQNDFSVRGAAEAKPICFESGLMVECVVNLAIEGEENTFIGVDHGLVAVFG